MNLTKRLMLGALVSSMASPVLFAADAFSGAQTQAIQKIVHEYLVNNPQVLIEASTELQKQQQKEMQVNAKAAILKNSDELLAGGMTVAGNPKGTVTLVEFFDYQCGHCKKMEPLINQLIKSNSNLRVVYKEFPIFGKSSELASKAALAAAMQGKYPQMQDALFSAHKRFNEALILETAKNVGLNVEQLKKDMNSDVVKNALSKNRTLAEQMNLMGTPAFVIVATSDGKLKANTQPELIPGGAPIDVLQQSIQKVAG